MELSLKQFRNIYFEYRKLMTDYFVYNIFMQRFKIDSKLFAFIARKYGIHINIGFHYRDLGFFLNLFPW